jgi:hypothetical protein
MATTRSSRNVVWFWFAVIVTTYVLVSASVAVATADRCGDLDGEKTWNPFPPHWVCPGE